MRNRRDFLRTLTLATSAATVHSMESRAQTSTDSFGVHDFIERNPDAVFITRTNIASKTDSATIRETALSFARSMFVPKTNGVPITGIIPIKPDLSCSYTSDTRFPLEYGMGIVTDPFFTEGIIEGMKELGISGGKFAIREVNCPGDFEKRGYTAMAARTGANIRDMSAAVGEIAESDLVWKDTPKGVWFRRIPFIGPVNAADSFLVNIAKFKAFGMGMALTARNIQGAVAHSYDAFETPYNQAMIMDAAHKNPTGFQDIQSNYNRHVGLGIPRWDKPGEEGGIWQETWASRCIDANSATAAGLHIIEGVYGRDGNGYLYGPNSTGGDNNPTGEARDYLSNVIIFGKNPFHTDIIGHWLAGHEPGNFGLFWLAKERGLAKVINPAKIPVYEWFPGKGSKLTPYTEFPRTPLKTYYLQRNYLGQTESYYHLCNEPCIYPKDEPAGIQSPDRPEAFVLSQNRPNPFNPETSIEFSLPSAGHARLEIYTATGQLADVLVDGPLAAGNHLAVFSTRGRASGVYFYRLRFGGFSETKKMTLVK